MKRTLSLLTDVLYPRKCPYCKSEIDAEATRCPHCTSQLN